MPVMAVMPTGRADGAGDDSEPAPHWVRRAVVAATVSGLAAYGLVALFGHGAHTAPRPQLATSAQQTGSSPTADGRPRLGVNVQMNGQAVTVASVVPGSAAARAGLHATDVVTAVDATPIRTPAELTTIVRNHRSGDQLHISIVRSGRPLTITATLDTPDHDPRSAHRPGATATVPKPPATTNVTVVGTGSDDQPHPATVTLAVAPAARPPPTAPDTMSTSGPVQLSGSQRSARKRRDCQNPGGAETLRR